ncbi:MAG: hypothetical protein A3B96_00535 [Candidatus Spechtbacteria bacterium RIFCSPHIGHO2_02_FULL_43_15b]|uniref:DUF4012 domain-containing protein n=1 Tax=Candidatus Spechtbacteria bacterium RIFCSPHIGHO2_01_FULL_43_30 TaxID=1802158 RepID=A0A1G2H5E4_9BACT|nr:MAG: hypothetical protein A2827_00215 [Candidatus Spechtbacteria bacterium RIFCSPHIGHO2_01_FULL_43_30]OGZ58812.1 MAG: hypothetical protein A3B96_00535 [Candidatus Spechtbacteria bacterium RIFCSPHIGHO2_02_FULL_43_15b]
MNRRKSTSNFFDIKRKKNGGSSPFVLDLRNGKGRMSIGESRVDLGAILSSGEAVSSLHGIGKHKNEIASLIKEGSKIFSENSARKQDLLDELKKFEGYEAKLASITEERRARNTVSNREGHITKPFKLKLIPNIKSSSRYGYEKPNVDYASGLEELYGSEINIAEDAVSGENYYAGRELYPDYQDISEDKSSKVSEFFAGPSPHKSVLPERDAGKDSFVSVLKKVGNFTVVSVIVAGVTFGGFFIYKGINAKGESVASGVEAYQNFKLAKESLKNLDFQKAAENFSNAYASIVKAEESLSGVGAVAISVAENLPFDSHADSAISLLNGAKHIALAGETLSSAFSVMPLDKMLSVESLIGLFDEENKQYPGYAPEVFELFADMLDKAEFEVAAAESEIKKVNPLDFPLEFQASIADLKEEVPGLLNLISLARDYSAISSELLGKDSSKRYLIVFQNSSEIRPTGGFIGSYAIVEFSQGKLKNMFIDGIYSADGQLTVNIVPPKPFQHIANAWSTHDANWFFDFPFSAEKISWFYEKTGGGNIDGVISVNIEVVERLLKFTGPIRIDEYDLNLDSKNFRDEIQYEVEVAYDKKLNRPKKILADFAPVFIQKLSETVKSSSKELLASVMEDLDAKNIMFYFKNSDVQGFFDNQGWTGRIDGGSGVAENKNNSMDYLAVVYSNIGGYKTSKFADDKVSYGVEVQKDGSILGNLRIDQIHNGGDSEYWWYNRNRIDYVKIYVPEGVELISYSGGERRDDAESPDYKELGFEEDPDVVHIESFLTKFGTVDIFKESGKTVFGTWLVTRPQKSTSFELRYKLPFKIVFENGVGKYDLKIQKQAGKEVDVNLDINTPDNWQIVWNNAGGANGEVSFSLDRDKTLGYILQN